MIRNFIIKFMSGRYGPDHLSFALIILTVILNLVATFIRFLPIYIVSYIILVYALFRILSRNIKKRRAENDKYLRYYWPVKTKIKNRFNRVKTSKVFKYFKCPSCKSLLRVPRGKGKIEVTCPKCGERFNKKT